MNDSPQSKSFNQREEKCDLRLLRTIVYFFGRLRSKVYSSSNRDYLRGLLACLYKFVILVLDLVVRPLRPRSTLFKERDYQTWSTCSVLLYPNPTPETNRFWDINNNGCPHLPATGELAAHLVVLVEAVSA